MTTKAKDAVAPSAADEFLNDNAITTADIVTPVPPSPVLPPPTPAQKGHKRQSWRDRIFVPNGLTLSRQMLPPITRRGTATYETLMDSKFDHRVIEGDKAIPPPPLDLPPTYMLHDRFQSDFSMANVLMKNVVRSESKMVRQMDGQMKPQIEEVLEYVEFINGQKVVNIQKDYMLYVFLECHPRNESSKWCDRSKKPLFRRTDFDYKSSHVQMLEMDLQDEATKYVKGLSDKELINLAAAMSNPTVPTINVPTSEIRYNMRLRARNNPKEVMYAAPDKKASKRIDVIHALEMGILEYLPERNAYYLTGDDTNPIFEVQMDANPLEDIAKYLASPEGAEDYEAIMEYVNYWKG